jgi:hypothetical protein
MSNSYTITNTWSHAKVGHAQDELNTIKNFLKKFSVEAQIASLDSEFGDIRITSLGVTLHQMKLDHSRLFKPLVDRQIFRDLSRCVRKAITQVQSPSSTVVITSSRLNHLIRLDKLLVGQYKPRMRILDAPKTSREWEYFTRFVNQAAIEPIIAMEVKSSAIESIKYLGEVIHVPSHYGLQRETPSINAARNRIGIFWPVGRSFTLSDIEIILRKSRFFNPIVKLPASVEIDEYRVAYPNITFIPHGTTDSEFRLYLSQIKIALLMHKNYVKQSSGYAGYFLANNVPIITSKSNSFFAELEEFGDFYAIEDYEENLSEFLVYVDSKPLSNSNEYYHDFSTAAWKSFLL